MSHAAPVIVVGGGWAGLAAAVELARCHIPVLLLESARQLGGRARSVQRDGHTLDNGQHLLLGAYEATLDLLRLLDVAEETVFLRRPLSLALGRAGGREVQLRSAALPAPLHLAWGLLRARGLDLPARFAALRFSHAMQRAGYSLAEDESVSALLIRHRQPRTLVEALWEPICLAALNTHIEEASAQIFLRTLGESFRHARRDSDLLLTRRPLGEILPAPALDYIERHGGRVQLGQRVDSLLINGGRLTGVLTANGMQAASQVILATPPTATCGLLKTQPLLRAEAECVGRLEHRPICTVYLHYPPDTQLPGPLYGSLGTLGQWIFDRRLCAQPGLMAVVISADGPHMALDNTDLAAQVTAELARLFPAWPAPQAWQIIREKRATMAASVGVNAHRPGYATAVAGLWLAGDYTDTGLPATLEGAVRSGLTAARAVRRRLPTTSGARA